MSKLVTITGADLCLLTGLTDRRHRQIAKSGYFPPPIRGDYQRDVALAGMFKYYREMGERTRNLKDKLDEEKVREKQLKNDETDKRLVDKEKLASCVATMLTAFRDLVYQKFENEAPTAMSTIDVPSARIIGRRMAGELLDKLQAAFKLWNL